jgi:hypothetical protein
MRGDFPSSGGRGDVDLNLAIHTLVVKGISLESCKFLPTHSHTHRKVDIKRGGEVWKLISINSAADNH